MRSGSYYVSLLLAILPRKQACFCNKCCIVLQLLGAWIDFNQSLQHSRGVASNDILQCQTNRRNRIVVVCRTYGGRKHNDGDNAL